jgi:hypothetical protein
MKSKFLLALAVSACALFAQQAAPGNYSGWNDTTVFLGFKADSLKYGAAFPSSDFENKCWLWLMVDTNVAGFGSDSVYFKTGYQRGYICQGSSGLIDTSWRAICWMDSFNMLNAGKRITTATTTSQDSGTFQENLTMGMFDTLYVTGYAVASTPFVPIWSPLLRPVIKGLTGNRIGGWIKVIAELTQRAYQSVRMK